MTRFRAARSKLDPGVWGLGAADRRTVYLGLMVYRLEQQQIRDLLTRLKVPRADADELEMLPELRRALRSLALARKPSAIYHALQRYPARILAVAWLADERRSVRSRILRYQKEYRRVEPLLSGDDLRAMGLKPGPLFGQLLSALRDARLDGKIKTREEEQALLRKLLRAQGIEL